MKCHEIPRWPVVSVVCKVDGCAHGQIGRPNTRCARDKVQQHLLCVRVSAHDARE
jgi:hypothetical protein